MSLPSSSSLPSSLPSFSTSSHPDLDELLERITSAKETIKLLQAQLDRDLDALDQMVQTGDAEDSYSWNDFTITRKLRKTYSYPDHITEQREALKASERLSVALGEATVTLGSYWEVRLPKG